MSKANWLSLINYYIREYKEKRISKSENKQLKLFIHIVHLLDCFKIAIQYLNEDKIRVETKEMFPNFTGYEDQSFILYHYETYGNCLYAYELAWANFLRELFQINKKKSLVKLAEDPRLKTVSDAIKSFVENEKVKKIIDERHDSVHIYGEWHLGLYEGMTQNWAGLVSRLRSLIEEVESLREKYQDEMSKFVFKQVIPPRI